MAKAKKKAPAKELSAEEKEKQFVANMQADIESIAEQMHSYCTGENWMEEDDDVIEASEITKKQWKNDRNNHFDKAYYRIKHHYDALDVTFLISRSGDYKGCHWIIGFGGPNTWIDTETKMIHQAWGGQRVSAPVSYKVCETIDDIAEESYRCVV